MCNLPAVNCTVPSAGLYIHVPFCKKKCVYCDFYSAADMTFAEEYVKAVIRNIRYEKRVYDTVYFGGGTPSLLTVKQVSDILSAADIRTGAEISMECNPESAGSEYLCELRSSGVNRLSFGVQSLNDEELQSLGRLHNAEKAERAVWLAEKAGFENVSADIMLAVAGQSFQSLNETLDRLLKLPLTHISAYMLKIEEGTPLSKKKELLEKIPGENETAEMYLMTVQRLAESGFKQYEISNFARRGMECRHNLKYWRCEEYFGVGPSAHSFLDGERFFCPADTEKFISMPFQERVSLGAGGDREERGMLALRLTGEGLPLCEYPEVEKPAVPLIKSGLLKREGDNLMLTPNGCLVSNEIICRLVM